MSKKTVEVQHNDKVEVSWHPGFGPAGEVELELFGLSFLYATPAQADALAVALIQASPPQPTDAEIEPGDRLLDEEPEYRVALGLALIRSAK